MFGLMRAKTCGMTSAERHFRRLNYCGTCKTIGSMYGQRSRLLLNHDTVFLAEILTALSGEAVKDRPKAYQSFNCLSLPAGEMPAALEFAATANLILSQFKLADHAADEGKRRYRLAQSAFSKEFRRAEKVLQSRNFPLAEVKEILLSQTARERAGQSSLDETAFPTAQTTGIFFREGARLVGRRELAPTAFEIGFAFGKLVYALDAFEDYEKDFRRSQFNALRAAFGWREEKLTPASKRQAAAVLHAAEGEVIEKLRRLPIAENQKTLFISRLSQNIQRKLGTGLPVLRTTRGGVKPKPDFSERWRAAQRKAGSLARNYGWQMPLVFLFVFLFALAAPAQTREAKSARECFDLSFNLMALGAGLGAVLAFPKTLLMRTPPNVAEEAERKRRWCDWCDCCECECCDCCECGCDNCDGCSGCCDNCDCGGCDCSCD